MRKQLSQSSLILSSQAYHRTPSVRWFFVGGDFGEKILSVNDKNHSSEMARKGQGAATALKAKAPKTKRLEVKSPAPTVDQDPVVKKPRGRPRKLKRDPHQSVNELCVEDGDGYADGTHTHRTHSHVVR